MALQEATDKPSGEVTDIQQPAALTIAKGDPNLPKDVGEWQIGDHITLGNGTITAIDEQGVTFTLDQPVERGGEKQEEPAAAAEDGETGMSPQTDYVTKARKGMMEGES